MNKLKHLIKKSLLPVTSVILFGLTVIYWNNQNYGLALEYNGKKIATVPNEKVYSEASKMLTDQLEPKFKNKVENNSPNLKLIAVNKRTCCESPKDITEKIIEESSDEFSKGYGLYVNKKLVAASKDRQNIQETLNKKLDKEKANHPDWEVTFEENINVEHGIFEPNQIKNAKEIEKIANSKVTSYREYTVAEEDNVENLTQKLNISKEEILKSSNATYGNICVGDKIKIKEEKNLLNVKIFKTKTEEEETAFSTETVVDSSKEENYKQVTQEGKNGKNSVTYETRLLNNGQEETEQINVTIIEKPTNEKIIIGASKIENDGNLIWPVPFTKKITSPFGMRGKSMHKGIDISSPGIAGKNIIAAGSGTVKRVFYSKNGYGKCVFVDHGDGVVTVYGHCQNIFVTEGDKVKQGEAIATVGTTGDSSGPHLHFEIRKNNTPQDPQKYFEN